MSAHEERKPVVIPGMCDKGPPSYRIRETPLRSRRSERGSKTEKPCTVSTTTPRGKSFQAEKSFARPNSTRKGRTDKPI